MHQSRTVKTTLALALAAGALTPSAASARPDLGVANSTPYVQVVRVPETQIVRAPAHNGFDWADAGIGAGAGLGLTLLGGGLVASRRRGGRPAHRAAIAG